MQTKRWPVRLWQNPGEVEPIPDTIVQRTGLGEVKVKSASTFNENEIANLQNLHATFVAEYLYRVTNYEQSPAMSVTQGGGTLSTSPVSSVTARANGSLIACCIGFDSSSNTRGYVFTIPSITSSPPWTQTPLTNLYLHSITIQSGSSEFSILIGNDNRVARSTNGTSFTETQLPTATPDRHSLNAISYGNSIVITGGGILPAGSNFLAETFVSTDNGSNWITVEPLLNSTITAINYISSLNKFIAHIVVHGAFSSDSGFYLRDATNSPTDTWQPIATGQEFFTSNRVTELGVVGNRVVSSLGIVSSDAGVTWEPIQNINGNSNILSSVRGDDGFFIGTYNEAGHSGLGMSVDGKSFFNIGSDYIEGFPSTSKKIHAVKNGTFYGSLPTSRRVFSLQQSSYNYIHALRYLDSLR